MKKTLVMLTCLLALAIAASAQENLNFANLPLVSTPTPVPNGYGQLNWTNFFYVDPYLWSGSGPGFQDSPTSTGMDVAFIGGRVCLLQQDACYGTITSLGGSSAFQAVSATVAGGFGPSYIIVYAYNNGNYVGSVSYPLGTQMQTINFPSSWGIITQLTLQTNGGSDLVLYDLQVYVLVGDPPPQ